jgi:segregation and condensation protein B
MPPADQPTRQDLGASFQELLRKDGWEADVPIVDTTTPDVEPARPRPTAATADPPSLHQLIEAMLFLGGAPLAPERAADVVRGLTDEQFVQTIDELNHAYRSQGRPYLAVKHEGGYILTLRPQFRWVREKLAGGIREARLSTASVECLAIVAYRQPATKQEVDSLRGHESGALLRQLLRRGLIAVVSRAESGGREVQYGTTPRFLELFGLKSLDDLPQTEDLQRL